MSNQRKEQLQQIQQYWAWLRFNGFDGRDEGLHIDTEGQIEHSFSQLDSLIMKLT
jgi:hypothetical protein